MIGTDLAADKLAAALSTRRLGTDYLFLPTCGSTSDEVATRSMASAEEGLLIATDEQSSGRGRRGRTWHSPPGENLYFSLLLRPALAPHRVAPMTLAAGAALAHALASLGFSPRLKWPNDVLLEGPSRVGEGGLCPRPAAAGLEPTNGLRKVAGILAEMASESGRVRHVVLGVGINVNTQCFPAELAEQATSLALSRGGSLDRLQVLAAFLNAFEPLYDDLVAAGPASGLTAWQRFALFGQSCWVEAGSQRVEGVAEAVDESGALLIRKSDGGLIPVHAGEVNWRKTR